MESYVFKYQILPEVNLTIFNLIQSLLEFVVTGSSVSNSEHVNYGCNYLFSLTNRGRCLQRKALEI